MPSVPLTPGPNSAERFRRTFFTEHGGGPFLHTLGFYMHTIMRENQGKSDVFDLAIERRAQVMIPSSQVTGLEKGMTAKLGEGTEAKISIGKAKVVEELLTREDRFAKRWREIQQISDRLPYPPMIIDHRRKYDDARDLNYDIQRALDPKDSIISTATILAELGFNPGNIKDDNPEHLANLLRPVGISRRRTLTSIGPSPIAPLDGGNRIYGIFTGGENQVNLIEILKRSLREAGMRNYVLILSVAGKDIKIEPLETDSRVLSLSDIKNHQATLISTDHKRRYPEGEHGDSIILEGMKNGLAAELHFQGPESTAVFCVIPAAMVTEIYEQI